MRESMKDHSIAAPLMPASIQETGLHAKFLGALALKSLYILGLETNVELGRQLKLNQTVVDQLMTSLKQQGFVEVLGSQATHVPILRYGLTGAGKDLAIESARQCEYVGPAPVPLTAFQAQVVSQSISAEKVSVADLCDALSHLVLPPRLIEKIGPAVNSARAMLVYGPAGNGKTSVSEAIGKVFRQAIYIPYCVEVDGQIIRMYDPTVHSEIPARRASDAEEVNLLRRKPDPRWVKCHRPVVIMGGELTLDMLDLEYDTTSKFYEAPPQVKALGGVFIVDDFGRQMVQPRDLLNRWIIPLERKVDYLTIHTGKKFDYPFDELVIFSTNLSPNKLMDAALMRRVKYKIRIDPPSPAEFEVIFRRICVQHGLDLPESILSFLLDDYYPRAGIPCAGYHPIFFVEHAIATCQYLGVEPHLSVDLVRDALENLFVADSPDREQPLRQARVS